MFNGEESVLLAHKIVLTQKAFISHLASSQMKAPAVRSSTTGNALHVSARKRHSFQPAQRDLLSLKSKVIRLSGVEDSAGQKLRVGAILE